MASTKPKLRVSIVVRKAILRENVHNQLSREIEILSTLTTKTVKPKIRYLTKVLIFQAFNHNITTKTDKIPNKITLLDKTQQKTKTKTKHLKTQTEQSFLFLHQTHKPKQIIKTKLW